MMERRHHPRLEASHPVLCFADIYARPKGASTLDLSLGGTRIETPFGLRTGESLEITIAIPSQAITCRGRAVYVTGPENGSMKVGIKFEQLSEYDKLYLRQYLSYALKREA
jgi:c-di-GMP-binding flagellar brake protein YcgR